MINTFRWAAQRAVPTGGARVTLRLAVHQNDYQYTPLDTPMFDKFAAYAVSDNTALVKRSSTCFKPQAERWAHLSLARISAASAEV